MSLRLDAENALELLTISAYPHMENDDRARIATSYQEASRDLLADIPEDDDYSGLETLKRNM